MADVGLPRRNDDSEVERPKEASAASASATAATPPGPPKLDLAKWNQAYKVTITNVTFERLNTLESWRNCSEKGYDKPTAANLTGCFIKKNRNGTVTAWRKMGGDRREITSAYCYALDTFKKGDSCYLSFASTDTPFTCALMKQALVADGAKPVSRDEALKQQPKTGHYIAVMVSTDGCNPYHCWQNDFHAARKDSNELWSWKEPGGPAANKDLFGNLIKDPEGTNVTAHYDIFCGYYHVMPSEMTVEYGRSRYDMPIKDVADYYSAWFRRTASAWAEPLPYNETTDGAFSEKVARLMQQDRLWESKRDSKSGANVLPSPAPSADRMHGGHKLL